jgi:hypothetical protein
MGFHLTGWGLTREELICDFKGVIAREPNNAYSAFSWWSGNGGDGIILRFEIFFFMRKLLRWYAWL